MSQLLGDNSDVVGEKWMGRMRALSVAEQADMLARAVRLIEFPDAVSTPLESELRVLAEQLYLSLGRHLLAR